MNAILALAGTGGPIIAILAILSFSTLTLIIVKIVQLAGINSGGTNRTDALMQWSQKDKEASVALIVNGRSPIDRVMHYALHSTMMRMPRKPLEAELLRRGNAEIAQMNRHIRLLELVAMIAPLLGLLGTVLGMIQSFQELELAQGAANASVLAGGIWQALLTTAAGLVVAIPAAIGATLLSARIESAAHAIETTIGQFFLFEDTGTTAVET
jgi:biopolymer transport protein ExbB|tara:strand:+ start:875 stop:1510 length:636 start_codon:yes stop_codon:yes gene_type:complete